MAMPFFVQTNEENPSRWLIGKVFVWILRCVWIDNATRTRFCPHPLSLSLPLSLYLVGVIYVRVCLRLCRLNFSNDLAIIWHSHSHSFSHRFSTKQKLLTAGTLPGLPFTLSLSFAFYEYQLNYEYLDTFTLCPKYYSPSEMLMRHWWARPISFSIRILSFCLSLSLSRASATLIFVSAEIQQQALFKINYKCACARVFMC